MSVRHTILAAAAIAAGLCNIGFAAAPAMAQEIDGVAVPYQDLNLAHSSGRTALDRRISAAAREVCGAYLNTELKLHEMSRICQAEVIASVQPRRDALVGGQRYASLRVSRAAN